MRNGACRRAGAFTGALLIGLLAPAEACAAPPAAESFFRKPAYGGVTLSPNGRYLAVVAPIDGRQGVIVLDLDTRKPTRMKSPGLGDLLRVEWQNDDRLVIVVGDRQRASGEPPHESGLVAVNRDGSDSRVIAAGAARNVAGSNVAEKGFDRPWSVSLLRVVEGTNDIIVTARERNVRSLDIYRYDTVTGNKSLLSFDSPGEVARWVVDFDGVARAAVTADLDHDLSARYVRKSAQGAWSKVDEAKLGRLTSEPLEFDPTARSSTYRRVPLAHGSDFRAALDRAHKDYEWVVYADEGHGFNKDENLVDFYGRVERFLARFLHSDATSIAAPAPEDR